MKSTTKLNKMGYILNKTSDNRIIIVKRDGRTTNILTNNNNVVNFYDSKNFVQVVCADLFNAI